VNDPQLLKTVDQIIADVRQYGDDHVLKLTQQFDRHPAHQFSDLELTQAQLKTAFEGLSTEIREALEWLQNVFVLSIRHKSKKVGLMLMIR
jgi:histidinol dehydrogenase